MSERIIEVVYNDSKAYEIVDTERICKGETTGRSIDLQELIQILENSPIELSLSKKQSLEDEFDKLEADVNSVIICYYDVLSYYIDYKGDLKKTAVVFIEEGYVSVDSLFDFLDISIAFWNGGIAEEQYRIMDFPVGIDSDLNTDTVCARKSLNRVLTFEEFECILREINIIEITDDAEEKLRVHFVREFSQKPFYAVIAFIITKDNKTKCCYINYERYTGAIENTCCFYVQEKDKTYNIYSDSFSKEMLMMAAVQIYNKSICTDLTKVYKMLGDARNNGWLYSDNDGNILKKKVYKLKLRRIINRMYGESDAKIVKKII